jgi:hypothetical protein
MVLCTPNFTHRKVRWTSNRAYAFIYSASGEPFTVDLCKLSGGRLRAMWYDPRDGTSTSTGAFPREGKTKFRPPSRGKGSVWVLVLDDESRGYPEPGLGAC